MQCQRNGKIMRKNEKKTWIFFGGIEKVRTFAFAFTTKLVTSTEERVL